MTGGEEREQLNSRDQDIAVWKLNFVTNVEIIEGEIKEGSQHQDSWLVGTTERDCRLTDFICLQQALKLSQISLSSAGKLLFARLKFSLQTVVVLSGLRNLDDN